MSYFYMMYIICLIWIININMCIRYTSGPALSESTACETVWPGQTPGHGHELASHHWRLHVRLCGLPCETVQWCWAYVHLDCCVAVIWAT